MEDAIKSFFREKVICAGRTDAGVHAKEQVAHFDTNLNRERHSWLRGINSFLPPSISVMGKVSALDFRVSLHGLENIATQF